ncbi:MAG: helix-turn-helix domain-containing protein [Acidobacteria bacterium]|nr:helix-turn-helix domain-containing protein [Acidobacteriota bacterium]
MGRTIKIQLSDEQRAALEKTYRRGASHSLRIRCQMILLKSEGRKSQEIADFLGFCQQAVNNWLHRYEAGGIEALETAAGGGRPPILDSANDLAAVRVAVQNHRQRISVAKAELEETLAKQFCERTLSRFLKNLMPVTSASDGDRKELKTRTFTS